MNLPSDYDNHGRLRLPALFWGVLVLQARTLALFIIAGASRGEGSALLSIFYPDRNAFWPGILAGLPAAIAFWLSGRRQHFPRIWACWHRVLVATQLALVLWQGLRWLQGEAITSAALVLLIIDLYALWWLFASRRLRDCFSAETSGN